MEEITMSRKELDRYSLLRQVMSKQLSQVRAAQLLGLSDRHVRNLLKEIQIKGAKGIVSKKRGYSNRSIKPDFKQHVMTLVKEKYPDFGPTFAEEKLAEYHNITISVETLRKWMIEEGLWVSKKKRSTIHPIRPRRNYFGELIQIDASSHAWFEDRGAKCALIVFIDDATSKITSAFFCTSECLEGYFEALRNHLLKYGRPRALYSDRHVIFGGADCIKKAQFPRALKELDIELILATSPQAKGRVERANQTLQDRLVKEMRLRNISNLKDANSYLEEFIEKFNNKFSKEPRGQFDSHRPVDSDYDLERTLTRSEIRILSKELSFSFDNKIYQILEPRSVNRLRNKQIELRQKFDGTFRAFYEGVELQYSSTAEYLDKELVNSKEKMVWNPGKGGHPTGNHPWKKYGYQWELSKKVKQMDTGI